MDIGVLHVNRSFKDEDGTWMAECKCNECGEIKTIPAYKLKSGRTTCICRRIRSTSSQCNKGESREPLYKYWYNLTCKKDVCDEWCISYPMFKKWVLAEGLTKGTRLEQIDPAKPFGPDNCIIVPVKAPATLTHNGETHTIKEWSEITGLGIPAIRYRLKMGWDVDKVLDTPPRVVNRRS